jgi:transcription elongation factor GreA
VNEVDVRDAGRFLNRKEPTVLTASAATHRTDGQLITLEGYESLRSELATLVTTSRPDLAQRLREARADGRDPAENGELMEAMQESQRLQQRISALEARIAVARVAGPAQPDGVAEIGTRVHLRGQAEGVIHYDLVGDGEADPVRYRISVSSPVGQAVRGRRVGEVFEVRTPKRRLRFEVLAVEPYDTQAALPEAA